MSGQITIRKAQPEDLPGIIEIENLCFPADMAYPPDLFFDYMVTRTHLFYAAFLHHRLAGFVIAGEGESGEAWIVTLDVHPELRRRGVGEKLIRHIEKIFLRAGIERMILQVAVENFPALCMYKKLGFKKSDYLTDYYREGADAFIMEKRAAVPEGV